MDGYVIYLYIYLFGRCFYVHINAVLIVYKAMLLGGLSRNKHERVNKMQDIFLLDKTLAVIGLLDKCRAGMF